MIGAPTWARFEERVEQDDLRRYHLAAHRLLLGLMALDERELEAELTRSLQTEPRRILDSLYMLLIELTGGPQGRAPSSPEDLRLLWMRARTAARVAELRPAEQQMNEVDLAAAQSCAGADAAVAEAVPAIASGEFTAAHTDALRESLAAFRAAQTGFALTPAGARLIGWKVANALNWLAQAAANRHEHEQAEALYGEAARAFAACAHDVDAARCQAKAFDALQARVPDADERLRRLNAALDTLAPRTLAHAQALVAMASLAADHGDVYAAGGYATRIVQELRAMGFPAPEGALADAIVIGWIDAIAPADPPAPNHFLGVFAAVLVLQAGLARVRMACAAEERAGWQAVLDDVSRIVATMPEHTALVEGRLSALMEQLPVPDWAKDAADAAPTSRTREYLEIMAEWNAVHDRFGDPPQDDAGKAEIDARAAGLVARARAFGDRLTISQALWLQAGWFDVQGRHREAVEPLQEAYEVVSVLGGPTERDAAISALSGLCNEYVVLGELDRASRTAGQAIEAIERDRYRINAPFLQSAFLSAYGTVFAIGVYSAQELGDYDTMLARTELSKARSSILKLLTPGADRRKQRATRRSSTTSCAGSAPRSPPRAAPAPPTSWPA